MAQRSIEAYDAPGVVASYDADMEVMHPNRSKMVQIALEVPPFEPGAGLRALDLGIGTGYFTQRFLQRFPASRVVAIDGAKAMVALAHARLKDLARQVEFRIGDFRQTKKLAGGDGPFDVVYSAFALHHLNRTDKEAVVKQSLDLLRPGGWFLNADIVVAGQPQVEERIQELRVAGIVERSGGKDARFQDTASTRRYLDDLEKRDADQPQTLLDDLQSLTAAGLRNASVFWLEYREAVMGGQK
jgi:tRNA (cmo5U34)-methyltransferase